MFFLNPITSLVLVLFGFIVLGYFYGISIFYQLGSNFLADGFIPTDTQNANYKCSELPSVVEIDQIMSQNQEKVASLLRQLHDCTNNVSFCQKRADCLDVNPNDRVIKAGLSKIKWGTLKRCQDTQGAIIQFYNTSGEEVQIFNNFLDQQHFMSNLPITYHNY